MLASVYLFNQTSTDPYISYMQLIIGDFMNSCMKFRQLCDLCYNLPFTSSRCRYSSSKRASGATLTGNMASYQTSLNKC